MRTKIKDENIFNNLRVDGLNYLIRGQKVLLNRDLAANSWNP